MISTLMKREEEEIQKINEKSCLNISNVCYNVPFKCDIYSLPLDNISPGSDLKTLKTSIEKTQNNFTTNLTCSNNNNNNNSFSVNKRLNNQSFRDKDKKDPLSNNNSNKKGRIKEKEDNLPSSSSSPKEMTNHSHNDISTQKSLDLNHLNSSTSNSNSMDEHEDKQNNNNNRSNNWLKRNINSTLFENNKILSQNYNCSINQIKIIFPNNNNCNDNNDSQSQSKIESGKEKRNFLGYSSILNLFKIKKKSRTKTTNIKMSQSQNSEEENKRESEEDEEIEEEEEEEFANENNNLSLSTQHSFNIKRALPPTPPEETHSEHSLELSSFDEQGSFEPHDFSASIEKVKDCGWYWGPLCSNEAEDLLRGEPDGSFIVRDSSDSHYIFSLTFKLNGIVRHVRIEHDQGNFSFGPLTRFKSSTIVDFVEKAVAHSRSGRYLFFLHRRPILGPMRVQLLHPYSRFRHPRSLQHMCRFVILKSVRKDNLLKLPLPKPLLSYLNTPHYYFEPSSTPTNISAAPGGNKEGGGG